MPEQTSMASDQLVPSPENCTRPADCGPCSCCLAGVCDCGIDTQCSCAPCYLGAEEPEGVYALARLMGPAFVRVAEAMFGGSLEVGGDA
jgi:hypothetical protein